jgi:photosystem II stability/assembly factor-like uncharacterized protein
MPSAPAELRSYVGIGSTRRNTPADLFKSTDAGKNWRAVTGPWPSDEEVDAVAIAPSAPERVYLATTGEVYASRDGGRTWSVTSTNFNGALMRVIAVDPTNPDTVYAGTASSGIYKSTDAGKTWRAISTGLPNKDVGALVIDPHAPRTIYAGSGSNRYSGARGVFRSTDGGRHWHPFNAGLANGAVRALTTDQRGRVLYAGTDGDGVLDFHLQP